MQCSNCGTENKDDAKFCGSCGHPLGDGHTVTKRTLGKRTPIPAIVGVIVVISIVICASVLFVFPTAGGTKGPSESSSRLANDSQKQESSTAGTTVDNNEQDVSNDDTSATVYESIEDLLGVFEQRRDEIEEGYANDPRIAGTMLDMKEASGEYTTKLTNLLEELYACASSLDRIDSEELAAEQENWKQRLQSELDDMEASYKQHPYSMYGLDVSSKKSGAVTERFDELLATIREAYDGVDVSTTGGIRVQNTESARVSEESTTADNSNDEVAYTLRYDLSGLVLEGGSGDIGGVFIPATMADFRSRYGDEAMSGVSDDFYRGGGLYVEYITIPNTQIAVEYFGTTGNESDTEARGIRAPLGELVDGIDFGASGGLSMSDLASHLRSRNGAFDVRGLIPSHMFVESNVRGLCYLDGYSPDKTLYYADGPESERQYKARTLQVVDNAGGLLASSTLMYQTAFTSLYM